MNIKDTGYIILEIGLLVYAVIILCWNLFSQPIYLLIMAATITLAVYYFKDDLLERWGHCLLTMQNCIWLVVTLMVISSYIPAHHYAGRGGGGAWLVRGLLHFTMLLYWLLVYSPMQWAANGIAACIIIALLRDRYVAGWFVLAAFVTLNTAMRMDENLMPSYYAYVKFVTEPQLKGHK